MKRSWIGLFLLAALVMTGLTVTKKMETLHENMEQELKQASRSAMAGDWETATRHSQNARTAWKEWEHFRACFADHTPVEEIDAALAALEVYEAVGDKVAFAAESAGLARSIAAVGEAHGLVWWNFF